MNRGMRVLKQSYLRLPFCLLHLTRRRRWSLKATVPRHHDNPSGRSPKSVEEASWFLVCHSIRIRSVCPGTERLTIGTRRSLFTSTCVTPLQNTVGYWDGTTVHSKASACPLLYYIGPTHSRSDALLHSQCVLEPSSFT